MGVSQFGASIALLSGCAAGRCRRGCSRAPSAIDTRRRSPRRALYEALSGDGTRSMRLDGGHVPAWLVAATLAAEDRRFWSHPGVDPVAIARAVEAEPRRGTDRRRRLDDHAAGREAAAPAADAPARRRGWGAKLHEAVLALRLEHRFTKREILALYLNLAPYGNQITGVERASRAYFGVDSRMLTPAQAAFLAGLPQRPTAFNPYRNLALAQSRQRVVLRRMVAAGALTDDAGGSWRVQERLHLSRRTAPVSRAALRRDGAGERRERASRHGFETTLDAGLQADIAGIIEATARDSDAARRRQRRRRRARQRDAASGSRGKARATTSTPTTAARSTARVRRASRARR